MMMQMKTNSYSQENMANNTELKAIVLNSENIQMDEIENVKIIRIKSEEYNLLIMKDYWPVVGEIQGDVSIEAEENYKFENMTGFFTLSHNVFHLIIKEVKGKKDE